MENKRKQLPKINKNSAALVDKLIKIGKLLSLENDISKVFKIILNEVMDITKADRGIVYICSEDRKELLYEYVKIFSLNIEMDSKAAGEQLDRIPLETESGELIMQSLATFVYHTGFEAHFENIYGQDFFQTDLIKEMDEKTGFKSQSMVAIPLVDHEENVQGIIELTNSLGRSGAINDFSNEHIEVLLSVASQAAITLSNKLLVKSLEKMIIDFTQAIAYAIDLKSVDAYKHVQNVANITNILAREINVSQQGNFAEFRFSEDELQEIAISGWLHDLGKIATSESLLNKNTKLKTSYDRIYVLELRFALLQQVIENKLLSAPEDPQNEENRLLLTRLEGYRDFLFNINQGSEFLTPEQTDLIYEIAAVRITHNGKDYSLLIADELENLLIKKGTLTKNEYKLIKEHASLTMQILSKIRFPHKFRNVPFIASMHHERLNGKGYPLGLKNGEIPLQARILAVADVFDALMSSRSYKTGYGLQKSLTILADMTKVNELDKDLLDIILENGIYLKFAEYYGENPESLDIEAIKKIYRS